MVVSGFPGLQGNPLVAQLEMLKVQHDHWRKASLLEPRGNDVLVGALLCESPSDDACTGVIFFNNRGYLGMCGHGVMGVVRSLYHLGRIEKGAHRIDTPVGMIDATLHDDLSVSICNVAARRYRKAVPVIVPGRGLLHGDIAWGGNWFFLIDDHGHHIARDNVQILTAYAVAVREALEAQEIYGENGALIDHVELFAEDPEFDSRNFVLCPGNVYDRSPCGTGTSAKLACLAADGKLAPGRLWRQASVIGSHFDASYELLDGQVIPTIRGTAHITAETVLLMDSTDPFAWSI